MPGTGRDDHEVELGYISGIFGVRGEVRLHLHNRDSDVLHDGRSVVLLDPEGKRYRARLKARSGAGRRVLGKLAGLTNREEAAALKGWKILLSEDALPPLDEGEFYVWRVVGLPVFVGETPVGHVVAVHESGPVDVFEVRAGGETHFVPALREFVVAVDVANGRLVLTEVALP